MQTHGGSSGGGDGAIKSLASESSAREFVKALLLGEVGSQLYQAREKAKISQAELAARLGTRQPAISRAERDEDGSMSIRRFVEWAIACGCLPRSLELVPVASFRETGMRCVESRSALRLFD